MSTATAASINFDELSRELSAMRLRFDRWNQSTQRSLGELKSQHTRRLDEGKAALASLERRQHQLVEQAREVRARLEAEREQVEGLQREHGVLAEQQTQLPQQLGHLQQVLEGEEARLAKKEKALADATTTQRKKLGALQQAVDLYRHRLGLSFRQPEDGGEELQLVFTQVDSRDLERQFMFAVRVQEDDTYEVTKCDPPVAKISDYLSMLNSTKSFCAFVRAMRREFRSIAELQQ